MVGRDAERRKVGSIVLSTKPPSVDVSWKANHDLKLISTALGPTQTGTYANVDFGLQRATAQSDQLVVLQDNAEFLNSNSERASRV